jgi:hypothetical protein
MHVAGEPSQSLPIVPRTLIRRLYFCRANTPQTSCWSPFCGRCRKARTPGVLAKSEEVRVDKPTPAQSTDTRTTVLQKFFPNILLFTRSQELIRIESRAFVDRKSVDQDAVQHDAGIHSQEITNQRSPPRNSQIKQGESQTPWTILSRNGVTATRDVVSSDNRTAHLNSATIHPECGRWT